MKKVRKGMMQVSMMTANCSILGEERGGKSYGGSHIAQLGIVPASTLGVPVHTRVGGKEIDVSMSI